MFSPIVALCSASLCETWQYYSSYIQQLSYSSNKVHYHTYLVEYDCWVKGPEGDEHPLPGQYEPDEASTEVRICMPVVTTSTVQQR